MNSKQDLEPQQFALRFFESRGALIEKQENGYEVLIPTETASLLNIEEHLHISADSDKAAESQAIVFNYGSELLDGIINAACSPPPFVLCRLEFDYLKKQGFDRAISERFYFANAVGRVEKTAETQTDYFLLTCRYLAQSDEQKMGLLPLMVNFESGAFVPDMHEQLVYAQKTYLIQTKEDLRSTERFGQLMNRIKKESEKVLEQELAPFLASMTRRLRRDVANLEEYYASLKKEMEQGLERAGISEQLRKERMEKIALLPDEAIRKKHDLRKKYSVQISLEPAAGMLIRTPVVKIFYICSIGKKKKRITLMYNPVTKSIDPLRCEKCDASTVKVAFSPSLELICLDCEKKA
jgi:hypothetical protein